MCKIQHTHIPPTQKLSFEYIALVFFTQLLLCPSALFTKQTEFFTVHSSVSLFFSLFSLFTISSLFTLYSLSLSTLYSLFPMSSSLSQNSSHFTHYNNPLTLFTDNAFTHYNSDTLLQCCYTKGEHTDSVGLNY